DRAASHAQADQVTVTARKIEPGDFAAVEVDATTREIGLTAAFKTRHDTATNRVAVHRTQRDPVYRTARPTGERVLTIATACKMLAAQRGPVAIASAAVTPVAIMIAIPVA